MITWQKWLQHAKIAWTTEGINVDSRTNLVHSYLRRADKHPDDSKIKIAARAFQLYKKESK